MQLLNIIKRTNLERFLAPGTTLPVTNKVPSSIPFQVIFVDVFDEVVYLVVNDSAVAPVAGELLVTFNCQLRAFKVLLS